MDTVELRHRVRSARALPAILVACLWAWGCAGEDSGGSQGSGGDGGGGAAGVGGGIGGVGATAGTGGSGGSQGGAGPGGSAAGSTAGAGGGPAGSAGAGGTGRSTAGSGGSATAGRGGGGSAAGAGGNAGTAAGGTTGGRGGAGGAAGRGGSAGTGSAGAAGAGNAGRGGAAGTGTAGTGGASSCTTPPPPSALVGWAAASGMGTATTTGGGNATPQTVTTLAALNTAAAGTNAAVIQVSGKLAPGRVRIGSNKTIVGLCGAEIHGHLEVNNASNVIIRNIKIVGYGVGNCALDPGYDSSVGCSSGDDAITVQSGAHHVWFDHCDVSDGTDGNLDITNGADFVTISWTKFHYTPRTDNSGDDSTGAAGHRFSNLIGGGDNVAADVGHLNVTWHHNWWAENVNQRMPRTRRGKIHLFNNLFTATGNSYCTNAGHEATLLVENNAYIGVRNPLQPDDDGNMLERDNLFSGTTGTKDDNGSGFMPTYPYAAESANTVQAAVMAGAGPR